MIILRNFALVAGVSLLIASPAMADDDIRHYQGKPANTLEQAVVQFSEYNNKLEKILTGELTPIAMNDIHQLTYTLENALEKMDDELDDLAETLELVHKASETDDTDTVRSAGKQYLESSRKIIN